MSSTPAPLSPQDIGHILTALDRSSWDQAEIVVGDVRIAVGRGDLPAPGAAPASPTSVVPTASASSAATTSPAPAPPSPAVPSPAPPVSPAAAPEAPAAVDISGDHVIMAPSVGVFWRAPAPGSPPFVEVGSTVTAGDTVGIVEVMKLMNNVVADVSGTVSAVLQENAAHVEYGAPLIAIRTDG
jgi:acetyl-CoA carboxylase biotin carboxyl carrier protein